ncbi:MAG: hypothetical protein KO206_03095 [Methanomicrobiaceae archaeon]|uniref:Glycosyl transferase, group 1 n=1 Tax=hydrocarbon metagenome TaxID=938273 RepID=A0A0W8FK81_9ZZZZ|nr:hypothetical protein [Methanomicrobiaceae archaeon]MDD5419164.1 hypothetical protein [Methanomicrobiaceae archaeon]
MRRGTLICLTGIDGSGKTTLSQYLIDDLNRHGREAAYVYGRYQPRLLLPAIALARRLFFPDTDRTRDYTGFSRKKRSAVRKHLLLSNLYAKLLLSEYCLQLAFRVSLPLLLSRKAIVCDRYILDTIVTDLAVDFDYSPDDIRSAHERIQARFPRPDITVVIDLPEEIAFWRKDDTPSIEYLAERRELYRSAGEKSGAVIIDGSLPLDQVKRQVREVVWRGIRA